jgi:hypothetical protein
MLVVVLLVMLFLVIAVMNHEIICYSGKTLLCLKLPMCFSCKFWQKKVRLGYMVY